MAVRSTPRLGDSAREGEAPAEPCPTLRPACFLARRSLALPSITGKNYPRGETNRSFNEATLGGLGAGG